MAKTSTSVPQHWLSLGSAAERLGETDKALRSKLERAARRVDGATVAELEGGVSGRKLGRSWKIRLGGAWL